MTENVLVPMRECPKLRYEMVSIIIKRILFLLILVLMSLGF